MREAKLEVVSFSIECPYCYELVGRPSNGSTMWLPEDVKPGQLLLCDLCSNAFTLPVNDERCELNW